jgi:hypothetical protein
LWHRPGKAWQQSDFLRNGLYTRKAGFPEYCFELWSAYAPAKSVNQIFVAPAIT